MGSLSTPYRSKTRASMLLAAIVSPAEAVAAAAAARPTVLRSSGPRPSTRSIV